jgi:hypothetical protein
VKGDREGVVAMVVTAVAGEISESSRGVKRGVKGDQEGVVTMAGLDSSPAPKLKRQPPGELRTV